jgi:hypothetical protein
MWQKEHFLNVSVLQRVRMFSLAISSNCTLNFVYISRTSQTLSLDQVCISEQNISLKATSLDTHEHWT